MGLILLYVFGYMESENSFTRAQFLRIFRFHMPRHTGLAQSYLNFSHHRPQFQIICDRNDNRFFEGQKLWFVVIFIQNLYRQINCVNSWKETNISKWGFYTSYAFWIDQFGS